MRRLAIALLAASATPTNAWAQDDVDAPAIGAEANVPVEDPGGDPVAEDGEEPDWRDRVEFEPSLQIFGQYAFSLREENGESDWYHELELPRAHLGLTARYENVRGRILLEAVRSAAEGALLGVGGDSLVLRLREAYGELAFFEAFQARVGLVPTLSVRPFEQAWGLRPVAPVAIERTGLASPADLGATLRGFLPRRFGWIGVGAYNGEGYRSRELNRGKNVELGAQIHPLAALPAVQPLALYGAYVAGSSGTGLAQANRIYGALLWDGERVGGGAGIAYGNGTDGDADRDALVLDVFARVEPIENLLLGGTFRFHNRNLDQEQDTVIEGTGAIGYRIAPPLEAFLAVDRTTLGDVADAALPGEEKWSFRAITHVAF